MQGIFTAAFALALAVALPAKADVYGEDPEDKNVFEFNVAAVVNHMNIFEYQRVYDREWTWSLRGIYWAVEPNKWEVEAGGGGFAIKKYTTTSAPYGAYMALGCDVIGITAYSGQFGPGDYQETIFVMPFANIGHTWLVDSFFFDVSLGGQYVFGGIEERYGREFPITGFLAYLNVGLGIAF